MELKDIYVITNNITGEQYVGQSKNTRKRWSQHCVSNDKLPIHEAMRAYGKQNFSVKILESQVENYNELEKVWIDKLNSMVPYGYNLSKGGGGYPHMTGVNCYQALFNQEQLEQIIELIIENKQPMSHIAKQFGVQASVIYGINYGWTYKRKNSIYPLRPHSIPKEKKHLPLKDAKIREEIKQRLEYPKESTQAIAEDYGVQRQAIEEINKGKSYFNPNWDYPLRKLPYNPKIIPLSVVQAVQFDLKYTRKSIREIGRNYEINRSTVSLINLGISKYYYNEKISYPIREVN